LGVAFHCGIPLVASGFVGVDVFFVISGFLITSLIRSVVGAGHFSLVQFFERRVRRIFPALFLMLAGVTFLASVVLFPSDLENYAGSLIATAGFSSNFYFWDRSGYFDPASSTSALLHTWSLAVEEQFYLVFPPLALWLTRKNRRDQVFVFGALLIALLAASIWAVREAPISAFYLLPFRMWELLLGACVAICNVPPGRNRLAKEALAAAGLFLIVGSTVLITRDMFPGEKAIAPSVGAALLIFSNADGKTVVARALSARPIVMVGLISYSLYLWHWPLLVIARYWALRPLTPVETTAVIAASVVLAALSWIYVERPFRARERIGRPVIARSAVAAVSLAAAVGAIQIYGQGFPERYPPDVRAVLLASSDRDPKLSQCFDSELSDVQMNRLCHIGAGTTAMPSFLVWGDSHADALLPAIDAAERQKGRSGYMAGHGSCMPIVGVVSSRSMICRAFNDEVLKLDHLTCIAVGPGLVGIFPGVEGHPVAHQGEPVRVELDRKVEGTRGERPVVLPDLGQETVGDGCVDLASHVLAEQPLGREDRPERLQMSQELILHELGDNVSLAPELGQLLEGERPIGFVWLVHARLLSARKSQGFLIMRIDEEQTQPQECTVPLADL
jgi:peptidoglycan/LPS O-acetylase OafA/YrhL